MTTINTRIRTLFATLATTEADNPILLEGELWTEKDEETGQSTGRRKVGDGVTAFNSLPFEPSGAAGSATDLSITSRGASTLVIASSTGADATVPAATNTEAGLATAAQVTKLEGIAAGATANATDAQLRDRSTHTGTQAAATITGLATVATSGAYGDLSGRPTLGGAAALNVGTTVGTVAAGDDARLSDARTPTAHTHPASAISDSTTAGRALLTAEDAAAQRTALSLATVASTGAYGDLSGTPTVPGLSSSTPSALGAAAAGVATSASRADHVHAMPSAADVGAAESGAVAESGLTMATARLLGRTTASTGAVEEISVGTGLSLAAGTLSATGGDGSGGIDALHIDASEFIPSTTAGCGIDSTETATNRVNRDLLTFDAGTRENATVWFTWPTGWATAKVTVYWMASSGTGSAVFGAEAKVYNDGDAIDSAWGTAQTVTDASASANTHRQTAATAAITPAGTVTAGCRTALRLYRDATNGSDDLAVDALVSGVLVEKAS